VQIQAIEQPHLKSVAVHYTPPARGLRNKTFCFEKPSSPPGEKILRPIQSNMNPIYAHYVNEEEDRQRQVELNIKTQFLRSPVDLFLPDK
jgi:hypothetical protein